MKPTLSIIIVLYNSADELTACLESIAEDVSSGWAEAIVVDNASPDESVAVARKVLPPARILMLDSNRGFAVGVNAGLPEARGPYVLLLNPDVTVPNGGLKQLVEWMDAHPAAACASPDIRGQNGRSQTPARAFPSIWRTLLEAIRLHKLLPSQLRSRWLLGAYWDGADSLSVDWVPGTAMIVRAEVIEEIGPLSSDLFMYGEDIEWCWRMRRFGYQIGVDAGTSFHHQTSASSTRSWGDLEKDRRLAAGVYAATRIMRGAAYAQTLAVVMGLAGMADSRWPRRSQDTRVAGGEAAKHWLELARGRGTVTTSAPPRLHRRASGGRPLVSVCIPTYNGARYVETAVASALAQEYEPLEVVIADDGSTDDTLEILRSFSDERIRLLHNKARCGHVGNRNNVIQLSRGELVKFLDQDDVLDEDCVTKMVWPFETDDAVGLVFCRRRIMYEPEHRDYGEVWSEAYGELHGALEPLSTINDGRDILVRWIGHGLRENFIGEPTAVMISRSHLRVSGGFNPRIRQTLDSDLWQRMLPHARVGFIDEQLVGYRVGHDSETMRTKGTRRDWLDMLWTLEALSDDPEVAAAYPELGEMLRSARRAAWRTVAKLGRGTDGAIVPLAPYLTYLRFRSASRRGRLRPPQQSAVAV